MALTITQIESQVQELLRDTTGGTFDTAKIRNSLRRCINHLIKDHGIYATKKPSSIDLFDTVFEYPAPSDLFDVVNIQDNGMYKSFLKTKPDAFYGLSGNVFSVDSYQNDHSILVKTSGLSGSLIVNGCESITDNGTWSAVASTDAQNVTTNTINAKEGSGAVSFDVNTALSGNNYAEIDNDDMTDVDLTDYAGKGTVFVWAYLPSVTDLTSITLRIGSDSSNYYSKTVTTQFNGYAFRVGYNRLGFSLVTATETGTVVDTAVDYIAYRLTYSSSFVSTNGFLIDDIRIANPTTLDLMYYSTHFVIDTSGVTKQYFTADGDTSLLDEADDDILIYHALSDGFFVTREQNDRIEALKMRDDAIARLKTRFGSEKKREVTFYR